MERRKGAYRREGIYGKKPYRGVEKGHTERGDTKRVHNLKETTQGRAARRGGRGNTRSGDHTERGLHGEEREDIQREEIDTESLEQTRREDYIERGLHGEGRGIYTERRLYGKELHGEGRGIYTETEQARRGERGEKGHTRKGDIYGEETTWRRARVYTKRE